MKFIYLIIALISFTLLSSCENDDICTEKSLTPSLIIRFKDINNPLLPKVVPQLLVMGKNKSEIVSFQNTDSLAIPLPQVSKKATFSLIKNAKLNSNNTLLSGEEAELEVLFNTSEQFVSKGCGYRTIYHQLTASPQQNSWISHLNLLKTELHDEKTATIIILH